MEKEEKKRKETQGWASGFWHPCIQLELPLPIYGNLLFYLEVGTLSKLWFFRFKLLKLVKDIMNESVGNDEAPYALNSFLRRIQRLARSSKDLQVQLEE